MLLVVMLDFFHQANTMFVQQVQFLFLLIGPKIYAHHFWPKAYFYREVFDKVCLCMWFAHLKIKQMV